MKTCARHGISFWNYLGDRLGIPGADDVSWLPDLARQQPTDRSVARWLAHALPRPHNLPSRWLAAPVAGTKITPFDPRICPSYPFFRCP